MVSELPKAPTNQCIVVNLVHFIYSFSFLNDTLRKEMSTASVWRFFLFLKNHPKLIITLLNCSRLPSKIPKQSMKIGICAFIIIVGSNRWLSIGNKFQSNRSNRSVVLLNVFVSCCPTSHVKYNIITVTNSQMTDFKTNSKSTVSFRYGLMKKKDILAFITIKNWNTAKWDTLNYNFDLKQ